MFFCLVRCYAIQSKNRIPFSIQNVCAIEMAIRNLLLISLSVISVFKIVDVNDNNVIIVKMLEKQIKTKFTKSTHFELKLFSLFSLCFKPNIKEWHGQWNIAFYYVRRSTMIDCCWKCNKLSVISYEIAFSRSHATMMTITLTSRYFSIVYCNESFFLHPEKKKNFNIKFTHGNRLHYWISNSS